MRALSLFYYTAENMLTLPPQSWMHDRPVSPAGLTQVPLPSGETTADAYCRLPLADGL